MEAWTSLKLLNWMEKYFQDKGIDAPRLSAEMLLSHVLDLNRIQLYVNFEKPVPPDKLAQLRELVKQAADHKPIAYLVGKTEFYSMEIEVNENTLIPRPETEMLVQRAIDFIRKRESTQYICDLCTGSGCITAAIAKNHKNCKIIATDICDKALEVAQRNIEKHSVEEQVHLICGNLFEPILENLDENEFDLIVSNPPYVTADEYASLDKNVKNYEPQKALLAGHDGLDIYRQIAAKVCDFLKPDGALIMEIGYRQGAQVKQLLEEAGCFEEIVVEKDYSDNDRVVTAYRKRIHKPQGELIIEEIKENQAEK